MREYRTRTTKDLLETYAWLNKRCVADKSDILNAKALIKKELDRRFKAVFEFMEDGQNDENPNGTLRYLLGE